MPEDSDTAELPPVGEAFIRYPKVETDTRFANIAAATISKHSTPERLYVGNQDQYVISVGKDRVIALVADGVSSAYQARAGAERGITIAQEQLSGISVETFCSDTEMASVCAKISQEYANGTSQDVMDTTLTGVVIFEYEGKKYARVIHTGDSKLLVVRQGEGGQITIEQPTVDMNKAYQDQIPKAAKDIVNNMLRSLTDGDQIYTYVSEFSQALGIAPNEALRELVTYWNRKSDIYGSVPTGPWQTMLIELDSSVIALLPATDGIDPLTLGQVAEVIESQISLVDDRAYQWAIELLRLSGLVTTIRKKNDDATVIALDLQNLFQNSPRPSAPN